MFSTKKKVLRSDCNLLRKLRAMIAIRSWIVLATVFTSCALAAAADIPTSKPQIQGGNLRIELDNRLRSRVVAVVLCFFAKQWTASVELRGLEDRNYSVVDYVTGKKPGDGVKTQRTSAG